MAVATLTLREHLAHVPGARIVASMHSQDDLEAFAPPAEAVVEDAELAEAGPFEAKPMKSSGSSKLTHFLDGAEKRRLAGYIRMLPMYLVHTSAAVVERRDREMLDLLPENYSSSFHLVVPQSAKLNPLPGVDLFEVAPTNEADDVSYRQKVRREISIKREQHEVEVASRFRDGWLLVDGGIGNVIDRLPHRTNVVGVVKSHQHRYFSSPERVQTILALKASERTTVFKRERDPLQGAAVDSFYLRMFESPAESPLFGLIRVELPEGTGADLADEVLGWLIEERAPLSLPDMRYDKMIYPIRLVEQHLKARQPSEAAIRGIQGV